MTIWKSKEEFEQHCKDGGFEVSEPYNIYTAPWNPEYVLMDDAWEEKVGVIDRVERGGTSDTNLLITRNLPDDAELEIYVDGYGHTLQATSKAPIGLDF